MLTPILLDEQALRRPEFAGGVPIRLWDGQEWTFPRPAVSGFFPVRNAAGELDFAAGYDLGPAYDVLCDRWIEEEDPVESSKLLLNLAALLLLKNYALKDADLRLLLYRAIASDPRVDESREMWQAIADVVLGRAPKPTPVGSASSSSPTG